MRPLLRGPRPGVDDVSASRQAQEERTHTVQRKETAFGIAAQYGVNLNRLFELNRWAEGGIRKGTSCDSARPARSGNARRGRPGGANRFRAGQGEEAHGGPVDAPVLPQKAEPNPSAEAELVAVPRGRPVLPHWPGDTLRVAVMLPFSAGEDSLGRQALRLRDIALDCAADWTALDSGQWVGVYVDVRFLDTGRDTPGALLCGPDELEFAGGPVDIAVGPLRRPALKEVRTWPGMEGAVHLVLTDLGSPLVKGVPGMLYPLPSRPARWNSWLGILLPVMSASGS